MRFIAILFAVFALSFAAVAETPVHVDTLENERNETKEKLDIERQILVDKYKEKLDALSEELSKESVWLKSFSSYTTYLDVKENLKELEERVSVLSKHAKTKHDKNELAGLQAKKKILSEQVELLRGQGETPFSDLMKPEEIGEIPTITNPIEIFTGLSFMKQIHEQYREYQLRNEELNQLVRLLRDQVDLYEKLLETDVEYQARYTPHYNDSVDQLDKFDAALGTVEATAVVYAKRIEEIEVKIDKEIKEHLFKLINIGIIILVLFVLFFLMKMVAKKYIADNERLYMANKMMTFANVTLVLLIILFNYIENVSYLVTVLGFASAGIAIAMKDWFMSLLGWLVIVFGGSIHVGDRVRVEKDGMIYVGDVLDISLLRITVLEDITLTTYMQNRRAGRVIFVPNNYIFTSMIANYTHVSLKTVWDGIDITITFDSNHKKAMQLAKEVARKYSKGYTDITRKQLNKLRTRYSLKNTNVEPRIFSFIEPNGIQISAWYLTNAYATLTLRSVISTDIIDAFNAEDDITIAYPTQKLHLSHEHKKVPPFETGSEVL